MNATLLGRAPLLVLALAGTAGAQWRFAPTVLQLPSSARALAMGDAFVAGRGSEVLFYNPAMIGLQPGMAASAQMVGSQAAIGAISGAQTVGPLGVALGAQMLQFAEDALGGVRTSDDIASGGPSISTSVAASLGIASQFKGVRFGGAAKFVQEEVSGYRDGSAAFDVGVAKDFFGRVTVGIAGRDIGYGLRIQGESFELPTRVTLGSFASAPPLFTYFDLNASAALSYRRDGELIPAGGIELTYVPLDGWAFSGRAGARRVVDYSGTKPLTLGAGLAFDRLSVDYAFDQLVRGGGSHRVGIRLR
jgi:hypothetical protein